MRGLQWGWHQITLVVTDRDGQSGMASRRIFVGSSPTYLPLILRGP
ncbi:MAG: hypothetical protein RML36_16230 [Anaerolineae bacterium]|nr:hypothetical protein [Anaerolineae bacterium]